MENEAEKVEKYKAALEKYEEKQREKARIFDIKALAAKTDEIIEVEDEVLGVVRFKLVKWRDMDVYDETRSKLKTPSEHTAYIVWLHLHAADPSVTFEDVLNLPMMSMARLVQILSRYGVFLPPAKP